MAKKVCSICGHELGALSRKIKCADGVICASCWKDMGLSVSMDVLQNLSSQSVQSIVDFASRQQYLLKNFNSNLDIGNGLAEFDDDHKIMLLSDSFRSVYKIENYDIFSYDQIVDFEILEDGSSIASGGLGRAAVGGFLFGVAGAIVGATTRSYKGVCSDLKIKITVKDCIKPSYYITLIKKKTKKNSLIYKTSIRVAQDLASKLQLIVSSLDAENHVGANAQTVDAADEIRKYKGLLDDGIITVEEFNAKKKELLNL